MKVQEAEVFGKRKFLLSTFVLPPSVGKEERHPLCPSQQPEQLGLPPCPQRTSKDRHWAQAMFSLERETLISVYLLYK